MPNHCSNKLVFVFPKGSKITLEDICTFVKGPEEVFDANAIVPMPEDIRNTECSTIASLSEAIVLYQQDGTIKDTLSHAIWYYYIDECSYMAKPRSCNFNYESLFSNRVTRLYAPIFIAKILSEGRAYRQIDLEMGARIISNRKLYGAGDWYTWALQNWDTKWGSYDSEVTDRGFNFKSAWSPSIAVTQALSVKYPNIKIEHYYCDESYNFAGVAIFEGGDMVKDTCYDAGDRLLRQFARRHF